MKKNILSALFLVFSVSSHAQESKLIKQALYANLMVATLECEGSEGFPSDVAARLNLMRLIKRNEVLISKNSTQPAIVATLVTKNETTEVNITTTDDYEDIIKVDIHRYSFKKPVLEGSLIEPKEIQKTHTILKGSCEVSRVFE